MQRLKLTKIILKDSKFKLYLRDQKSPSSPSLFFNNKILFSLKTSQSIIFLFNCILEDWTITTDSPNEAQ